MRIKNLFLVIIAGYLVSNCVSYNPDITEEELQESVEYLASDSLKGRRTGTVGMELAANYIAEKYKQAGLKPLGDSASYFKPFDFTAGIEVDPSTNMRINGKILIKGTDYQPYAFSANAELTTTETVFAGYGIRDESSKYDDYQRITATGKTVIVMDGSPDMSNPHSAFSAKSTVRAKAKEAENQGAALLIVVSKDNEVLPEPNFDRAAPQGIPIVTVSYKVIDELMLQNANRSLASLQKTMDSKKRPVSLDVPNLKIDVLVKINYIKAPAYNVIGVLPGADPVLAEEYIVLGAHFDHLGVVKGGGASRHTGSVPDIHNGADDNASGTAGLLELAQALAGKPTKPMRSIIFAAFSGEELGLLGSAALVEDFPVELSKVKTMLNFDMIGRMDSTKNLIVYGLGSSPQFDSLLDSTNKKFDFKLAKNQDAFGASDHSSFYMKDIPVLFFNTGLHDDYHRPSDDAEKINYKSQKDILEFAYDVAVSIANGTEPPTFTKVATSQTSQRMRFNVSIGTFPDYGYSGVGLRISGFRAGSPADKAGMKEGDIIVELGKATVKNIYDYMTLLSELKPDQEIEMVVVRNGEQMRLMITPEKR